jgi:hypothetical protein
VTSLDGQNGCCGIDEGRLGKEGGAAQVGTNADVFNNPCCGSHGSDVCQDGGKVESASSKGCLAKCLETDLNRRGGD